MAEKLTLNINTFDLNNGSGDITTSTTINPGSSAFKSVNKTAMQPLGEDESIDDNSDNSHKFSDH